ncbi:MAG: DnaA regulatory inactivator Hda [Chromatiaceae bacterium]|nr:MAG: DnaA regulatory inactivator Hda [Chromatiaceae bacterium]
MGQLGLPLRLPAAGALDRFVVAGNLEAFAALRHWLGGDGEPCLFLHGEAHSGKTHLLQGAADDLARRGRGVLYLPLGHAALTPAVLADLERLDGVIIDALEAIAGEPAWERGLFDLYNRLREAGRRLLAAARQPPAQLALRLPDLRSRLGAGPVYGLRPLDDSGRAELLRRAADDRGLPLEQPAIDYILARCRRDPGWLCRFVERLDAASLAARRAPTVRFIASLLERSALD